MSLLEDLAAFYPERRCRNDSYAVPLPSELHICPPGIRMSAASAGCFTTTGISPSLT